MIEFSSKKFTNRLNHILSQEPVKYWIKEIGVAPSLISSGWKKGTLPNLLNLVKLCQIKNISPTWLLFGIGESNLPKNPIDNRLKRDDDTVKIFELAAENRMLKEENKNIKDAVHNLLKVYLEEEGIEDIQKILKNHKKIVS